MKTNLKNIIEEDHSISNVLALECYNLEKLIDQQFINLNQTQIINTALQRHWNIGMESYDDATPENKKHILEKLWDFIIKILTKIKNAVHQFFTGIDVEQEKKNAKQAEEILKTKENNNIDFVNDIVSALSASTLAVISAIEEEKDFVRMYDDNLTADSKITVPSSIHRILDLQRHAPLISTMDANITQMNEFITQATNKDEEARNKALRATLASGFSINGSENAAYLKSFTKNQDSEKKCDQLTNLAEELKRINAAEDKVELMKKIAVTFSKQFTLEARVVDTYIKLTKAIIGVNNKIYAEYNKWLMKKMSFPATTLVISL